jgi:ABC-type multidrug transport system ATPase subunit
MGRVNVVLNPVPPGSGRWPREMGAIERIELRGVTCLYGSTVALRAVNMVLLGGGVTFIEGANGAGKSTLMGVIGTLVRPTQGTVVYAPLGTSREAVRPHLGWVSHESRAYRDLTARENVELAARLYGVDPEGAWERVGNRVELGRFAGQRLGTLSRGQRQRVALARALVHEPAVLLLDEPTTGLDSGSVERVEALMREEAARGVLVVVVTHDGGVMERVGGRRIRLERGRVV